MFNGRPPPSTIARWGFVRSAGQNSDEVNLPQHFLLRLEDLADDLAHLA